MVGAAVRVRAGRDPRGGVGGLLLVHSARRAARPSLLRTGRAARCLHPLFVVHCHQPHFYYFYHINY